MRTRLGPLMRLAAVIALVGAGVAMVASGVLAVGCELARVALGASSIGLDLGPALLLVLVGGECLISAFALGQPAPTREEA